MSLVILVKHEDRPTILIGLEREDIDHLIAGDVILLAAEPGWQLPDLAIVAGEDEADLKRTINEMNHD